jgi:hypothetical protein
MPYFKETPNPFDKVSDFLWTGTLSIISHLYPCRQLFDLIFELLHEVHRDQMLGCQNPDVGSQQRCQSRHTHSRRGFVSQCSIEGIEEDLRKENSKHGLQSKLEAKHMRME